jgi:aminoglycoside 2'-N-acetyltransferase I
MTIPEKSELIIEIHPSSTLPEEMNQQIDLLDHLAFNEGGEDEFDEGIEWGGPSDWNVLGWVGDKLVSQICVIRRTIRVGDQTLCIGGIGGVATHPDWRKHGYARALLQAAEELMRREGGFDFGMLFCAEEKIPFYGKSGYIQVYNPLYITQKSGKMLFNDIKMVLPLSNKPWPEGNIDVQGKPW